MTNYYHVLGLSENATPEEIKAAFKRQAVKYHPDKHPGKPKMEDIFKEVNQAYQVLSDPYEKARYDLKLKYRQFSEAPKTHPYSYNRGPRRRPAYAPPRVDYRQNAIATLYAFGITFGIALLVMTGVWIKQGYDEMRLEQLLQERRQVYDEAKALYFDEKYESAFELMASLDYFRAEEEDMEVFKRDMVDNIISKGDVNYEKKAYKDAIQLYELVQRFEPHKPFFEVKTHLAEAYKKVDQPKKSIEIYEELMLWEYRIIASLVEIAEIKRDLLEDLESAKDNFMTAHRLAEKQYKSFYGDAYSIVIDQRYVPEEHYYLYTGLADIYFKLGDHEKAIRAAIWNKYVWPDSTDAFLLTGNAYLALNRETEACREFNAAIELGWQGDLPVSCN